MITKSKRNLVSFLTTLMFLALVSVFCMPMMANAAAAHTAHSGHKDHEGWTAVSSADSLVKLGQDGGSGYLTCDITLEDAYITVISKELNLCLNGYSITYTYKTESNNAKISAQFDLPGNDILPFPYELQCLLPILAMMVDRVEIRQIPALDLFFCSL